MNPIRFTSDASPTVLFACGHCGLLVSTFNQNEATAHQAAERCCKCDLCDSPVRSGWVMCPTHLDEQREARRQADRVAHFALPIAEGYDGPVLAADSWYGDIAEAVDSLDCDGYDLATVVAYPAIIHRPSITDQLVEWAAEWLSEACGGDDDDGPELDAEAVSLLHAAGEHVNAHVVRDMWDADTKRRVDLSGGAS